MGSQFYHNDDLQAFCQAVLFENGQSFSCVCDFIPLLFSQDWWNSTSYSNYYRTWNVVVHDWLYYYAYKDLLWVKSKT